MIRDLPYVLAIDILGNYCQDFWAGLSVLWLEIALIFTMQNLANYENTIDSLQYGLLIVVIMSIIYVLLAVLMGTTFIKSYELDLLRGQDERLTYYRKDGIIVFAKDEKRIVFINKSAQDLLIGRVVVSETETNQYDG